MCSSGPPGPPGPPGQRGQKGSRGRRGQKGRNGNKGDKGIMGSPGKSGKQGMMGPVGPQGQPGNKGQKGDTGPAGMPGTKGEPGESISAPTVAVAPAKLAVNEGGSALFQCSVSGNPAPVITWSKLEKQSEISQSADLGGKLVLQSVMGSDSGVYKCSAANILGKAQTLVRLEVNGNVSSFLSLYICNLWKTIWFRKRLFNAIQGQPHRTRIRLPKSIALVSDMTQVTKWHASFLF